MRRDLEDALMRGIAEGKTPREIIPALDCVPKQAWRTLEKWCDKDWYEYGVTVDLGWLTPEGCTEAVKRGAMSEEGLAYQKSRWHGMWPKEA